MSLDIETIIDRRRLKRRLSLWRIAALVALGVAIIALLPGSGFSPTGKHVARVTLSGLIIKIVFDQVNGIFSSLHEHIIFY